MEPQWFCSAQRYTGGPQEILRDDPVHRHLARCLKKQFSTAQEITPVALQLALYAIFCIIRTLLENNYDIISKQLVKNREKRADR